MTDTAAELANRLFKCIESKDIAGVAALYHDDIAVWHNFTGTAQSKTENLRNLGDFAKAVAQIRYAVLERIDLGGRVIQRHDLHCRVADGREFAIPACIFITVENGRIRRIEEYLDTAQVNPLRDATQRPRLS